MGSTAVTRLAVNFRAPLSRGWALYKLGAAVYLIVFQGGPVHVHDFAREALKVFRISQTYGIKLICASEVGIQTSRLVRYEFLFGPKRRNPVL